MRNKIKHLLSLIILLFVFTSCSSSFPFHVAKETKPSHNGVFIKIDGDFIELSGFEGEPKSNTETGIPVTQNTTPTFLVWLPNINMNYISLIGPDNNENNSFSITTQSDGILEIATKNELSPGRYCFVQGDPLGSPYSLPHWCFDLSGRQLGSGTQTQLKEDNTQVVPSNQDPTPEMEPETTVELPMPTTTGVLNTEVVLVPQECQSNNNQSKCAIIKQGHTIKIGFAGPMTGDYSPFGIDISNAGKLAVQDAGEFEGFEFELLIEDTQGSVEGGASAANKFTSDPEVVAIAGHTFSDSSAAAIPIYNEARLPMLSPSATRASLTGGSQDIFNRIAFTDKIQGASIARYIYNQLGISDILILHDGEEYGASVADSVETTFKAVGGEVYAKKTLIPGENNYSALLSEYSDLNPGAIFFGGYFPEAAAIAKGMSSLNLENTILFSDDGALSEHFIELAGDHADGTYAASGIPAASNQLDKFNEAYRQAFGSEIQTVFRWYGYDAVRALIEQIKKVAILGGDGNLYIPREDLVNAINNMSGYQGLIGELTCVDGECNNYGPTFFIVKNGKWERP